MNTIPETRYAAIKTDVHRWTESLNGIRVYVVDKETHDRETAIWMALQAVARRGMEGAERNDIRLALRDALGQAGEKSEPPDEWVESISEGKPIHVRLSDLQT